MLSLLIFIIGLYVYTTSIMSSIRNQSQVSDLIKLQTSIEENKKTIDVLLSKILKLEQWKEEINSQQLLSSPKGKKSKTPVSSPPSGSNVVKKATLPTIKKELGNSDLVYIIEDGIRSEMSWEELINHLNYIDKRSKPKAPPRKELLDILIQQNEGLHWGIAIEKKDILYEFIQQTSTPTKKQSVVEKVVDIKLPLKHNSDNSDVEEEASIHTKIVENKEEQKPIPIVVEKVMENKLISQEDNQSSDDEDEQFEESVQEPVIQKKVEEQIEKIESIPIVPKKVEEKKETNSITHSSNMNCIKITSIDNKELLTKSMLMKVYDIKLNGVSQVETLKTKMKTQVLSLRESIKSLFPNVFVKAITSDYYNDIISHCDTENISLTIQLIKTSDMTKPSNVEKEIFEYCSTNCLSPPVTKPIANANKLHQSMVLNTNSKPSNASLSKSCVVHHTQDSDDDEEFEDMESDDEEFEEDD
jgi:hypothetical protein